MRLSPSEAIVECETQARLAGEFPAVPVRVIVSVLAAYRRITPSWPAAAHAARTRITDACAI